jgi:hypothetical protein
MDRKMGGLLVLLAALVFGFYGIAIGGGAEDPFCQDLPAPTSGHFINGHFTAALDKSYCGFISCGGHHNIHLELKRHKEVHLFSFLAPLGDKDICSYSDVEIKELFKGKPCELRIEEAFNLRGIPVVVDLSITKKDFCDTYEDAMISGEVLIRVVHIR